MNFFRNLKKGVGNLISWFPIIWNDRDWDYYFIYDLLHFKLNRMERYIRKYGHHVDNEKDADSIKECVVILERLMKDDYVSEDWDKIHEKWGEFELVEDKAGYSKFECSKVETKEDKEKYGVDVNNCYEKEEDLIQKDVNDLFENMKNNIRGWWD